ncbi:MAG TPA: pirin family protein [Burkholderiales bacterium]|nr:pirin family protein [Burkholderiales bacterium]
MSAFSLLKPHTRDLGDFAVKRLLPGHPHRTVGPFVFLDHMGPVALPPGKGADVRPHPHIGLATVTYLFEGQIVHRDSLGSVQRIAPGDVNWMTAGRGIVHSERTAPELRDRGPRLHGIQTWVALPRASELAEPAFHHHPQATLPRASASGVELRVIAGTAFGKRSPVAVFSPTLYVAAEMQAGGAFELDPEHEERGVYAVDGEVSVGGAPLPQQHLAVLEGRRTVEVRAATRARLMLLGGAGIDGERLIWWNFVASSRELIEEAKRRWREQRFPGIPGETEFIPLPDR